VMLILALATARVLAAEPDGKPTVVPAVLRSVTPTGVVRGGSVTLTLEGARLAGATGVYFDDPALRGQVLPAADAKKMDQVRVQAAIGIGHLHQHISADRFSQPGPFVLASRRQRDVMKLDFHDRRVGHASSRVASSRKACKPQTVSARTAIGKPRPHNVT